ncbi:MAG: DUF4112 domain-containing protein [Synechococcales cyanobacterium RM1_1_8]|nr:DUF4112 domain-containing protein [Synechococcales cyanobacterium RM1_1_8]
MSRRVNASQPSLPAPSTAHGVRLQQLQRLSHLLDNAIAIPGTSYRFGLDPFLGLVPGAGDVAGTALSAYIVIQAARWKLPTATLLRMLGNVCLDWLVGTLPMLGDLFDLGWKANARNVALLENHLNAPQTSQAADRWVVFLVIGALGLLLALSIALAATVLWGLFQFLGWLGA